MSECSMVRCPGSFTPHVDGRISPLCTLHGIIPK